MTIYHLDYDAIDLFKEYRTSCIFAHGANCQNTMNSGIAKEVKHRMTPLYIRDRKTVKGDLKKLGTFTHVLFEPKKYAFNLYTQFRYGRDRQHFDYTAFEQAFISMKEFLEEEGFILSATPIIMPKIGCGLGGGDWDEVEKILGRIAGDAYIVVCSV